MREDVFREITVDLTLKPEQWSIGGGLLLIAWKSPLEIHSGLIFGSMQNTRTTYKWFLTPRQNRIIRKLLNTTIEQRTIERDEDEALRVHQLTHKDL